ncbi:hypothetical protein HK101_010664 [Irineochytrium annulatum]|nr:hypothetical protein HK101_010664 [Irineochytrium annulatum]
MWTLAGMIGLMRNVFNGTGAWEGPAADLLMDGEIDLEEEAFLDWNTMLHTFFADVFEGQIITSIAVIIGLALLCLKEYIVMNTPLDPNGNPMNPPDNDFNILPNEDDEFANARVPPARIVPPPRNRNRWLLRRDRAIPQPLAEIPALAPGAPGNAPAGGPPRQQDADLEEFRVALEARDFDRAMRIIERGQRGSGRRRLQERDLDEAIRIVNRQRDFDGVVRDSGRRVEASAGTSPSRAFTFSADIDPPARDPSPVVSAFGSGDVEMPTTPRSMSPYAAGSSSSGSSSAATAEVAVDARIAQEATARRAELDTMLLDILSRIPRSGEQVQRWTDEMAAPVAPTALPTRTPFAGLTLSGGLASATNGVGAPFENARERASRREQAAELEESVNENVGRLTRLAASVESDSPPGGWLDDGASPAEGEEDEGVWAAGGSKDHIPRSVMNLPRMMSPMVAEGTGSLKASAEEKGKGPATGPSLDDKVVLTEKLEVGTTRMFASLVDEDRLLLESDSRKEAAKEGSERLLAEASKRTWMEGEQSAEADERLNFEYFPARKPEASTEHSWRVTLSGNLLASDYRDYLGTMSGTRVSHRYSLGLQGQ